DVLPAQAAEGEDGQRLDVHRAVRLGDREALALEVLGLLDAARLRDGDRKGVEAAGERAQVLRPDLRGAVLVDAFRREEELVGEPGVRDAALEQRFDATDRGAGRLQADARSVFLAEGVGDGRSL